DGEVKRESVGARPGEKLHEELWSESETVSATEHSKILLVRRPSIDPAWLEEELAELERLIEAGDTLELVARLGAMMREPRHTEAPVTSAALPLAQSTRFPSEI